MLRSRARSRSTTSRRTPPMPRSARWSSVAPTSGSSPFAGDVTFRATATGNPTAIEFRLNNVLRSVVGDQPGELDARHHHADERNVHADRAGLRRGREHRLGGLRVHDEQPELGPDPDAEHPAALQPHPHRAARLQRQPDGRVRAEPAAELRRSGHPEPALPRARSRRSRRTRRS